MAQGVFIRTIFPAEQDGAGWFGQRDAQSHHDLIRLAAEHDLENAREMMDRFLDAICQWNHHAAANGIPAGTSGMVAAQHHLTI